MEQSAADERKELNAAHVLVIQNRSVLFDILSTASTADQVSEKLVTRLGISDRAATHVMQLPIFRLTTDQIPRLRARIAANQDEDH